MDAKTFCNIMNRIRKVANANGTVVADVQVAFALLNGEKIKTSIAEYDLHDDYVEAWSQETECFYYIPFQNILTISV